MANGIPTDPPVSRTLDYGALVREAWGDEWLKHEKVYKFGRGRTFESSDYGTTGIYGTAPVIDYSGTAAGGGSHSIFLGTDANGGAGDYVGHRLTATDFATTTYTGTIVGYTEATREARIVPEWSGNFVFHTGTAQAGTNASLTLGTGAPTVVSGTLSLTSGAGSTQSREVLTYDGSTKVAGVSKWDAPYLVVGDGSTDEGAQATFYLNFPDLGSGVVDTTPTFGTVSPTFTRATAAWTRNSAGARIEVASGSPRSYYATDGTYLGYLAEGARTNHFLNSDAPVTQTSASLGTATYTLWIEGSGSVEVAANTATITGAGTATEGSPVTFVVTGAGTVDYTVSGTVTFAQSENGAFASTWIVTAAAAVTRNADVLTYPTSPWLNASAGTMFAQFTTGLQVSPGPYGFFSLDDGTSNEMICLRINAGNIQGIIIDGGITQTTIPGTAAAINTQYSFAEAYQLNDCAATVNGNAPSTDTTVTLPTVTSAGIGLQSGGSQPFGPIRRVAYFPQRLLNSTLQTITAGDLTFSPSTFPVALPGPTTVYSVEKVGPGVNTTYSISATLP